jgi:hypothetical protein
VNDVNPHFKNVHVRQSVGLDGPDLVGQQRQKLMVTARNISHDSIQQFNLTQFHIASQLHPGAYYTIDLLHVTCNCRNFPYAWFCKHIAAIYVHFPHLSPEEPSTIAPSVGTEVPGPSQHVLTSEESLHKVAQDIMMLSQKLLLDHTDQLTAPAFLQAARLARYTLTAALASLQGSSSLPDKDVIAPNQKNSWAETAERMGAKKASKKHKRLADAEEHGLTEQCIGATKGKRHCLHNDPYARGERSGKHAKPNVRSAAANVCAHTSHSAAVPAPTMPTPTHDLVFFHEPHIT